MQFVELSNRTFAMPDFNSYNKEKAWRHEMRTSNRDKKVISLNAKELRLLRTAMIHFRNKVISEGKPADDINELLLAIMG